MQQLGPPNQRNSHHKNFLVENLFSSLLERTSNFAHSKLPEMLPEKKHHFLIFVGRKTVSYT